MTRATTTRSLVRFGVSLTIAASAAVWGASAVGAVSAGGPTGSTTQSCPSDASGANCTVGFQFQNSDGSPQSGVPVTLSVGGVAGASIAPTQTTTDNAGGVQAVFSAGTTNCGTATITAATRTASVQTTVNVACSSGGSLPNTSASPPSTPVWPAGLAGLAVLTLAGGGFALRRARATAA